MYVCMYVRIVCVVLCIYIYIYIYISAVKGKKTRYRKLILTGLILLTHD